MKLWRKDQGLRNLLLLLVRRIVSTWWVHSGHTAEAWGAQEVHFGGGGVFA